MLVQSDCARPISNDFYQQLVQEMISLEYAPPREEKRKQSKLKDLLILLSRILAISFLVIAFSKPYIPDKNKEIISELFEKFIFKTCFSC